MLFPKSKLLVGEETKTVKMVDDLAEDYVFHDITYDGC